MNRLVVVISLIAMFGCSSSSSAPGYNTPAAGNSSGRSAASIGTSGGHLVDANGYALYETGSSCTGGCLTVWPPVDASQLPTATNGANSAAIGLSSGQVTYNGHLLYYFESDTAPGEATGNGVGGFSLVSP